VTQPVAPSHPTTTMKRTSALILFLLLGLAVAFVGCDTTEDDPIDETLVGTWNAASASVIVSGFGVPVFDAGGDGELSITFTAADAFTFVVEGPIEIDPPIGESVEVLAAGEGATIMGEYSFSSGDDIVTFTPTDVDGQPVSDAVTFSVPLEFEDDNTVVLSVENTDEGRALLGALLGDEVPQEVIDNIDGGEVTFERNS